MEAQEVIGICCAQLGFLGLEEQVASKVCEATSWASMAAIGIQGWDRPGWRQICHEPSQYDPICLAGCNLQGSLGQVWFYVSSLGSALQKSRGHSASTHHPHIILHCVTSGN